MSEDDLLKWESLVIGPALSPYAFGFFTFRMQVPTASWEHGARMASHGRPLRRSTSGGCRLTVACVRVLALCVQFPEDYPSSAPHIVFLTTNGGKTRFNPNLYADGKVCLSILGTWRGESGEQWSSVQNCQVLSFPLPFSPCVNHSHMRAGYAAAAPHERQDVMAHAFPPLSVLARYLSLFFVLVFACACVPAA